MKLSYTTRNVYWRVGMVSILVLMVVLLTKMLQAGEYQIEVVSLSSTGVMGNKLNDFSAISGNGRFVVFASTSDNLVPDDTNGKYDVFVHDRETGETSRVSVSTNGQQGNADSGFGGTFVSGDGRFVLFDSGSDNLVPDDTNGKYDVFVHDRETGETSRVNVSTSGIQTNGSSQSFAISEDGQFVVMSSSATNLILNDTNGKEDVFVHNRETGETSRISIATSGQQGNGMSYHGAITPDGRYVIFTSESTNLVENDTNGKADVFMYDRTTGDTSRVSVSSDGQQGNGISYQGTITSDGRYVAFTSEASNLITNDANARWDVFVHDQETGETSRISISSSGSEANLGGAYGSINADGRFVAFLSHSNNLTPNDTNNQEMFDVFIHDRTTGRTKRVNLSTTGQQANGASYYPIMSDDGQFLAFSSLSDNFVPNDLNNDYDVFVVVNSLLGNDSPIATPEINFYTTLPLTLTWSRVSWATEYEIQVDLDSNFATPVDYTTTVSADVLEITLPTLADGSYYWHVRAKAPGRTGNWSATNSFVLDAQ